jgi:hypothetical protein
LEVIVLRLVRIALLVSVSFVTGAAMSGCNDDTTNTNPSDMAVVVDPTGTHDLAPHE